MMIGSIINGEEKKGKNSETLDVINPYSEEKEATVSLASKSLVDEAISVANHCFHNKMKAIPAYERAEILRKTSDLLEERKREFAETITKESGKPMTYSLGEVDRSIQVLRFSSEEAKQIKGEVLPMDAAHKGENRIGMVKKVPLGVVGAISPFNFPLNLALHKIGPALAAGNTVVFKPAGKTPITGWKITRLFHEAGLPEDALNLILGSGKVVGQALVEHIQVAKISFTGSLAVGKKIKESAGLKKVTLELGSNSPNVIFKDAKIDEAVEQLVTGAFAFSGQVCISAQRVYVQKDIYEQFLKKFSEKTKGLTIGDPLNEQTDIGPMINEEEAKRAKAWMDEAVDNGATIETGGERNGAVLTPTIMTNVKGEMKINSEEVFAPIVSVIPFDTESEVIEMANDSIYGLQAGVFTQDIDRAIRVAEQLEVGGVWINETSIYRQDNYPYGGVKQSGVGREGVPYAIEDMTESKFIGIKVNYTL